MGAIVDFYILSFNPQIWCAGHIIGGISDPYDVPSAPELQIETENVEVDNCAHQVLLKLESMGLIGV